MFVPGLTEGSTDGNGVFNSGTLGVWTTGFGDLLTGMQGLAMPPFLLHNDATAPTEILAFNVVPLFASQRRRIRKVGGRRTGP
jgi:hypothetical protein